MTFNGGAMSGGPEKHVSKILIVACYFAIYFIWGSTYLAISLSIKTTPIFLASAIRFVAAGGALLLIARFRGARKPSRPNLVIAFKSGMLAFFVSFGLLSWAEKILPSSTAALIIALEPAWFLLFDWLFFLGPKPGRRIIFSQLVGMTGCAVLVFGEGSSTYGGASAAGYALSAAAVTLSGFAWVYGALLASKSPESHKDSAMASGLQMMCGGLIFAVLSVCMGDLSRTTQISTESWLALLYLIVFGSVAAYSAYIALLRSQPTSKVSTHSFINPIVAVFLGWAVAGEAVTIYTAIAGFLIVLSVAGIIRQN
ncbi:MAG: EamA family transporter [Synergistaceae bacterium]|jgi:drug/metabolite transporter (DMT)-like permease|nr:EamA family transporter [Synergistaceae bacterium]